MRCGSWLVLFVGCLVCSLENCEDDDDGSGQQAVGFYTSQKEDVHCLVVAAGQFSRQWHYSCCYLVWRMLVLEIVVVLVLLLLL